ncbi:hypothetical protein DBR40_07400 [Pedobacter sp. KBW01]|nr:hypothetical protein DBR40_07400 [Pedobacter sp. KBW01]
MIAQTPSRKESLKAALLDVITTVLILLWAFAALTKLLDYGHYRSDMHLQFFDGKVLHVLVPALPYTQICAALFLLSGRHRIYGLWLSMLLMMGFTVYVATVYYGYLSSHPKTCNGLFENSSWGGQLVINLGLLLVSVFGIILYQLKCNPWKTRP